ncbi:hypothetical protein RDI58_001379 [Solanum bulbocastanum]|uniref:Uncharacterized protein n=1 Tax=Solanum bulbocastanum TaxID=147425 RepID=A0AAN8YPX2_SOLBU
MSLSNNQLRQLHHQRQNYCLTMNFNNYQPPPFHNNSSKCLFNWNLLELFHSRGTQLSRT